MNDTRVWAVRRSLTAAVVIAVMSVAPLLAGCTGGGKDYDISPIFPLSEGKCAEYGGEEEGEGFGARCMVTQEDCERAAADWRSTMEESGVNDAIDFTCD